MNERIKELYEQSLIRETGKDHAGNPMLLIKQNPEKFAELIVKECMNLVTYVGHSTRGFDCCGHVRFTNEKIKEHFGVEE
jgi:hypothetical protein